MQLPVILLAILPPHSAMLHPDVSLIIPLSAAAYLLVVYLLLLIAQRVRIPKIRE